MCTSTIRAMLLAAAFTLAGCGGGGGVAFIPTPPAPSGPRPAQTYPILGAAVESQQFAAVGASHAYDGSHALSLEPGSQLQVRYVASSNAYEVQVPGSSDWTAVSFALSPGPGLNDYFGDTARLWVRTGSGVSWSYEYSALFEWDDSKDTIFGHEAVGMATPSSGVPVMGSADYVGDLIGVSSEPHGDDYLVAGTVNLSFDFAAATLTGQLEADLHQGFGSITLNFSNTVYSTGSTTFSGKFDTDLTGVNSFSGLFTGPNAQELIGNFAFPYRSPNDNLVYQADGAFVAKK